MLAMEQSAHAQCLLNNDEMNQ
jgi:hypothetical protein